MANMSHVFKPNLFKGRGGYGDINVRESFLMEKFKVEKLLEPETFC